MAIFVGIILVAIGLLMFIFGVALIFSIYATMKVPTLTVGEIAAHAGENRRVGVRGRIVCDTPLLAPMSQTHCIYYFSRVLFKKGELSLTLAERSKFVPFFVEDDSGRIRVDPFSGIDLDGPGDPDHPYDPEHQGAADDAPMFEDESQGVITIRVPAQGDLHFAGYSLKALLAERGLDLDTIRGTGKQLSEQRRVAVPTLILPPRNDNHDDGISQAPAPELAGNSSHHVCRFFESSIPVDREIYVIGQACQTDDGVELRSAKAMAMAMIISLKDKTSLIGSKICMSLGLLVVGGAVTAGGVFMAVGGF